MYPAFAQRQLGEAPDDPCDPEFGIRIYIHSFFTPFFYTLDNIYDLNIDHAKFSKYFGLLEGRSKRKTGNTISIHVQIMFLRNIISGFMSATCSFSRSSYFCSALCSSEEARAAGERSLLPSVPELAHGLKDIENISLPVTVIQQS